VYPAAWPESGSEKRRLPGKHSVDAANRVESEWFETFEALARTPGQGHKRTDLTAEAVLFFPVYSYLVVYRPEKRPLEVVAIIHGAGDVRRVLKERGGSQ